jgi:hypothetical protein
MYAHCAWRSMPVQVADFGVARWPGGFGAGWALPRFSGPVLSCRRSRLQPTPTGAFEKVRFAIQHCTRAALQGMHAFPAVAAGDSGGHAQKQCARRGFAPERCRATPVGAGLVRELTGLTREVALIRHDIFIALQLR